MTVAPGPPIAPAAIGPRATGQAPSLRRLGEKWYAGYLFILPHFAVFIFMIGIPFFYNIYLSLSDYTFGGSETFIGLDNFGRLADPDDFHFPVFWNGLVNTVIFVLLSTPMLVIGGLFLAILVNGKYRGRNVFRAVYFVPWTLGIAVVGLLWWWIFNGSFGLLTNFLTSVGIASPQWLTTNPWAWITILLATLWWTVGFNTIVLLAGLQSIAVELYEAATVDGANRWQQFRSITVPSLRPVLLLVVTLQVIASFNLVGQPQIMTGGGPGHETRSVLQYVYETGFTAGGQYQLGQAAAMALVVAAIMLVVSIVNFRVFRSDAT
jgi:multiple sugar transport system permease protein